MGPFEIALVLGILALFSQVVKGLTGFGSAIVFVSIGSLFYEPLKIIVLASLLDFIAGSYLVFLNPDFLENRTYWAPIGFLMVFGAVIGSFMLSVLPSSVLEYLFGAAIILISVWFLSGKSKPDVNAQETYDLSIVDGFVGVFSGFSGGFVGMAGPPLVAYLGDKLDKELFRAMVVPVFLMAATSRVISYGFFGMIPTDNPWLYIFPIVGVLLGNSVGNHYFDSVEQKWFAVAIGIILLLSGLRILIT